MVNSNETGKKDKYYILRDFQSVNSIRNYTDTMNKSTKKCDEFKPLSSHNNQAPENLT